MKTQQKTFTLSTIGAYAQAERYKAMHENKGAQVTTTLSHNGDRVTITAQYK